MKFIFTNSKKITFAILLYSLFSIPTSAPSAHASLAALGPSLGNSGSLATGLVGWWTFDGKDMSNGVALDRTTNHNNGNLINISTSTFYATGKIGQAGRFDGVSDYVNIPYNASLRPTTAVTYAFWIKRSTQNNIAPVVLDSNNDNHRIYYDSQTTAILTIILKTIGNNGGELNIGTTPNNVWTHAAVAYDGSSIKTYINGVVTSATATSTNLVADTSNEMIGCRNIPCTRGVAGLLDDVRIYNRALTAQEVLQLYNMGTTLVNTSSKSSFATSTPIHQGITGWWTMDGPDTNWTTGKENNQSGSGSTGANLSLVKFATTTAVVPGKIGQAIKFGGYNYMFSANPMSAFMSTATGTMSVWFYANAGNSSDCTAAQGTASALITDSDNTGLGGKASLSYDGTNLCAIGNDGSLRTVTTAVPIHTWTHAVWVHKNGSLALWKNGAFVGAVKFANASNLDSFVYLGRSFQSSHLFFNGYLDDARIYSTALSTSTIQLLYNNGMSRQNISPSLGSSGSLASGLVSWWTFDGKDMSNGVALDRTTNANNGNLINISTSTFYTAGKMGQGFNFDGGRVQATNPLSNFAGPSSVCMWVKPKDVSGNYEYLASFDGTNNIFFLSLAKTLNVRVMGFGQTTTGNVFSTGSWTHTCYMFNGATLSIYINGILASSNSQVIGSDMSSVATWIGRSNSGYWHGLIDDVRIYNRALSAAEVGELYQMGK